MSALVHVLSYPLSLNTHFPDPPSTFLAFPRTLPPSRPPSLPAHTLLRPPCLSFSLEGWWSACLLVLIPPLLSVCLALLLSFPSSSSRAISTLPLPSPPLFTAWCRPLLLLLLLLLAGGGAATAPCEKDTEQ